jgi:formate dehydrogenase iron-sulfur subunit
MTRFFVPGDAAAVSVGADEVAAALTGQPGVEVVRTGSRGMLWLEPLVEVDTADGRVGFANVSPGQVGALLADATSVCSREPTASAGPAPEADHPAYLGPLDEHPWMTRQARLTTARLGVVDPADPDDYARHGGWVGLRRALGMAPEAVVEEVVASGLRGRGGAGFPAGVKWRTVAGAPGPLKFVCCNADEGDSGTFADRMLIEGDPFTLIEGMAIAALAVGASEGYVYIRGVPARHRHPAPSHRDRANTAWLGPDILGQGGVRRGRAGRRRRLHLRRGDLDARVHHRGRAARCAPNPRSPRSSGLFGRADRRQQRPHALRRCPMVLADGPEAYAALGTDRSRGTQVFQLAGNVARGGIVEADFGITLRDLVEGFGGGTRSGRPVRRPSRSADRSGPTCPPITGPAAGLRGDSPRPGFDAGARRHRRLRRHRRHAGRMARFAMEFCAKESCGKCTPCRIGSQRGVEVIDRLVAGGTESTPGAPRPSSKTCARRWKGLAVRDGRADADAGAQRPHHFPRTSGSVRTESPDDDEPRPRTRPRHTPRSGR